MQYVDWVEDELRDTLRKDYRGIDDYEVESLLWNYVMLEVTSTNRSNATWWWLCDLMLMLNFVQYECCGLDGPYDFVNVAEQWRRSREASNGTVQFNVTLDFPVACCKSSGDFPEDFELADENCALDQTEDNTNMQVRLMNTSNSNKAPRYLIFFRFYVPRVAGPN